MTDCKPSRRSFLQTATAASAALAAGGSLSLPLLARAPAVHAGGHGRLKIGLVGCGGRGSGAAVQALVADKENVLWAMGDTFADRVEKSHEGIVEAAAERGREAQVDVPPERRFSGFDAIDKVLASDIDAVLLATPPGFRPGQIEKAVAAGKHVFAEKPVAVDAPGVRRVRAACAAAKAKGLVVTGGFCYRYHDGRRELVKRLQQGAVGEILALHGNYVTGGLWHFPRKKEWSDLEFMLRNWLYWPWLSGDLIAEQHVHTLDVMAWIKKDVYPATAYSLGGRQSRIAPEFGTVFDHFATVYEWADGTKGFSYCRQQEHCWRDVNEYVLGTEGRAKVFQHEITGKETWRHDGTIRDMYQVEHDEMFASIRGTRARIDDGDVLCNSTMMALMGRMAAYTGKQVFWDEAWASKEVLMPDPFDPANPPKSEIARPGFTKFV